MRSTSSGLFAFLLATLLCRAQVEGAGGDQVVGDHVVKDHAAWCHSLHRQLLDRAKNMQATITVLLEVPNEQNLDAARLAWIAARELYGQTEVLRFHDGPIEPLEPLINSWPVDECYIESVDDAKPGIVDDRRHFPQLSPTVLQLANERGGEANVCTGWHAIEFLLWGRDLDADGPGRRPAVDFDGRSSAKAARRGEFLRCVTTLLVGHLAELEAAWAPDRNSHRRRFERETTASLRRMLVGATVLTAFELGGERLTAAYVTRDQEQEHSCFSDTTTADLVANQLGIEAVLLGPEHGRPHAHCLVSLVRRQNATLADLVEQRLAATMKCLRAIPAPFDQAVLGDDTSPGRRAMQAAIESLEQQTEVLLFVGRCLGFELPLQPGG